jgi:hypothetical protein
LKHLAKRQLLCQIDIGTACLHYHRRKLVPNLRMRGSRKYKEAPLAEQSTALSDCNGMLCLAEQPSPLLVVFVFNENDEIICVVAVDLALKFYCLTLGGLKPSPSGDSFSVLW